MNFKYGVMQGRLSTKIGNKIQAFPIKNWKSEFSKAKKLGLKSTDIFGNDLKPDNLINDVPDWFIFGWPKVHEELINLINNKE